MNVNRANLLIAHKKVGGAETHLRCGIYCIRKSDRGIKIGRRHYDNIPIVELGGNEMAIESHFGDGNILAKGRSNAQIAICGFIRDEVNRGNKDKVTYEASQ